MGDFLRFARAMHGFAKFSAKPEAEACDDLVAEFRANKKKVPYVFVHRASQPGVFRFLHVNPKSAVVEKEVCALSLARARVWLGACCVCMPM